MATDFTSEAWGRKEGVDVDVSVVDISQMPPETPVQLFPDHFSDAIDLTLAEVLEQLGNNLAGYDVIPDGKALIILPIRRRVLRASIPDSGNLGRDGGCTDMCG